MVPRHKEQEEHNDLLIIDVQGSEQGHAMIVKQLWPKCRLRIVFPKRVIYVIESPDHSFKQTYFL